jgi:haloalkane dehalogenase
VAVYRFVQDIPASPRHPTWQTLEMIEAGLARLANRPVLLIWGMRDWCFRPSCLERFRQHFPDARLLRLPDAGHWVVEEAPEEVAACLRDFLSSTAAT